MINFMLGSYHNHKKFQMVMLYYITSAKICEVWEVANTYLNVDGMIKIILF